MGCLNLKTKIMKNYILLLATLLSLGTFMLSACCDDDTGDSATCSEPGVILGIDTRECLCCGGWFIDIGTDTLRALDLPQEFKESLDSGEFPLRVKLDWTPEPSPCLGDEIKVSCIQRSE